MKFLCVQCDEAMKLECAEPPDDGGSIQAVFGCPSCSHQIAMLTNAHETQLVQSLGVRIGPAPGQGQAAGAESQAGACPFSGMVAQINAEQGMAWTAGALERLERIPEFVRPMAKQGIEHYAEAQGHTLIDDAVMEEARSRFDL